MAARLFVLQVLRSDELTARGTKQWTRSGIVAARRGDIQDTNGKTIAQSVTSFIASARMPSGRLIQKISDQCTCSVRNPPSTGPPMEEEANTAPI